MHEMKKLQRPEPKAHGLQDVNTRLEMTGAMLSRAEHIFLLLLRCQGGGCEIHDAERRCCRS